MSKLNQFPETGWCKSLDERLIKFLKKKFPTSTSEIEKGHEYIAWNENSYWFVKTKSDRDLYEFEQLEPFLEQKKYEYEVVHCTTQEEWDFVNSKLKREFQLLSSTWKGNAENSCKVINRQEHSSISFFKKCNSKIYSFEEWCKEFNHEFIKPEYLHSTTPTEYIVKTYNGKIGHTHYIYEGNDYNKNLNKTFIWENHRPATQEEIDWLENCIKENKFVPKPNKKVLEYVECLKNTALGEYTYGKIYSVICREGNVIITLDDKGKRNGLNKMHFKPSTKELYEQQNNPQEDLLTKAKRLYPIGTKFKSSYLNSDTVYTVDEELQWWNNSETDIITGISGASVYTKGKWAEIIEQKITNPASLLKESELDKWLKETKEKNLSLEELYNLLNDIRTCPYNIYCKLKGESVSEKAKILWSEWNKTTQVTSLGVIDLWVEKMKAKNPITIEESFEKVSIKPQLIQVKQLQILN